MNEDADRATSEAGGAVRAVNQALFTLCPIYNHFIQSCGFVMMIAMATRDSATQIDFARRIRDGFMPGRVVYFSPFTVTERRNSL